MANTKTFGPDMRIGAVRGRQLSGVLVFLRERTRT